MASGMTFSKLIAMPLRKRGSGLPSPHLLVGVLAMALFACSDDGSATGGGGGTAQGGAGQGGEGATGGAGGTGGDVSTGGAGGDVSTSGGFAGDVVVDSDWLMERLEDPSIMVVDTRATGFAAGHIPGAVSLLPTQLAGDVDGVALQLLPAGQGQAVLQAQGLRDDATAVVYGEPPEYDPARIVWALRAYGHADVRYLDGGWAAWQAAGGAVESDTTTPSSNYTIDAPNDELRVTGQWVLDQLGPAPYDNSAIQLVDARTLGEYQAGHIPTAVFVPWTANLSNGLLRSAVELDVLYLDLDKSVTTVAYCLVGWRASVAWLALTAAGFEDVRVYDGSWEEWSAGTFPVE